MTAERSETKHSPEPWRVDGEGIRALVRANDAVIVAVRHRLPPDEHDANARRIVAAVNAVAGTPTEALESGALRDLLTATAAYFAPCPDDLPEDRFVEYLDRHYDDACSALRRLGRLP